jgi:hypothetical protein
MGNRKADDKTVLWRSEREGREGEDAKTHQLFLKQPFWHCIPTANCKKRKAKDFQKQVVQSNQRNRGGKTEGAVKDFFLVNPTQTNRLLSPAI